jgi:hypothetical protein
MFELLHMRDNIQAEAKEVRGTASDSLDIGMCRCADRQARRHGGGRPAARSKRCSANRTRQLSIEQLEPLSVSARLPTNKLHAHNEMRRWRPSRRWKSDGVAGARFSIAEMRRRRDDLARSARWPSRRPLEAEAGRLSGLSPCGGGTGSGDGCKAESQAHSRRSG